MLRDKEQCYECKKEFDWNSDLWNISIVPGYKTKIHKCECGHEMSTHIPVSEEKIKFWSEIL